MSKKLLEESTIRQFMKLARLEPLSENFLEEKGWSDKKMQEEYDTSDMTPDQEVSTDIDMMEELDLFEEAEEEEMEMEVEEDPDMGEEEAEITITPEQAKAIMAVAEMLKGIMPELSEPEVDMEEPEVDMEEPEADMEEPEVDMEEPEAETAAGEEEALAEAVMKRVLSRLKKAK